MTTKRMITMSEVKEVLMTTQAQALKLDNHKDRMALFEMLLNKSRIAPEDNEPVNGKRRILDVKGHLFQPPIKKV